MGGERQLQSAIVPLRVLVGGANGLVPVQIGQPPLDGDPHSSHQRIALKIIRGGRKQRQNFDEEGVLDEIVDDGHSGSSQGAIAHGGLADDDDAELTIFCEIIEAGLERVGNLIQRGHLSIKQLEIEVISVAENRYLPIPINRINPQQIGISIKIEIAQFDIAIANKGVFARKSDFCQIGRIVRGSTESLA